MIRAGARADKATEQINRVITPDAESHQCRSATQNQWYRERMRFSRCLTQDMKKLTNLRRSHPNQAGLWLRPRGLAEIPFQNLIKGASTVAVMVVERNDLHLCHDACPYLTIAVGLKPASVYRKRQGLLADQQDRQPDVTARLLNTAAAFQ
jgi:hypothetical protein